MPLAESVGLCEEGDVGRVVRVVPGVRERECQEDRIRLVNTFHVFTGRRFAFICPFDEFEEVQSATKFFGIYRVLRFQGRDGEQCALPAGRLSDQ